jgi:hypothetical protein
MIFFKAAFVTFVILFMAMTLYRPITDWIADPCKGWKPDRQTWAEDQYRWSHCPNGHDADN